MAQVFLFDEIIPGSAALIQSQLSNIPEGEEVELLINSPGGSVPEGMAIASIIKSHPTKVTANVIGLAASMATIAAMAADTVNMVDGAIWMIHHPLIATGGNAKELKEKATLVEAISKPMINIYSKKTGLGKKVISALMDEAELMPAARAKGLRFVDKVTAPLAAVAQLELTNYKDMNLTDLKAKVNDFAKELGWADTTEEEKATIEAKAVETVEKVEIEVKKEILDATTAEEAITAELVLKTDFEPQMAQVLDALHTITQFIQEQPTEAETAATQKKAAEAAVTELLKDIKSKVSIPARSGDPVIARVDTPFKDSDDNTKLKEFGARIDARYNKNIN